MVCFASWKEAELAGLSDESCEYWQLVIEPDKFCLLEDGHAGEHEFTPQGEIELSFTEEAVCR